MSETPPPTEPAPVKPTILGVDESEPTPEPTPVVAPVATPVPVEEPKGVTLTQDQYDEMVQNANNYQAIAADPIALAMVHKHFSGEAIAEPVPVATPTDGTDIANQFAKLNERMDQMGSVGENLQEQMATMALADFGRHNPDFETNRVKIGSLMQQYPGMTLPDALKFAKADAGPPEPVSKGLQPAEPTQPVVETNSVGTIPEVGDLLQDVEKKISDSKQVPDFGDAVKMAVAAAKEVHGMR